MLGRQALRDALQALGHTLADRHLHFHIAIIGGGALLLRHEGVRPTQDVDVVAAAAGSSPLRSTFHLPKELSEAAEDVAFASGSTGTGSTLGLLGSSPGSCLRGSGSD